MTSPALRQLYLDRLRIAAIVLVVAHHAAQTYGPTGGTWPVFEAERSLWLGPFFGANAAFFMGLFFLLAGLFVPHSLDRRNTGAFMVGRLLHLGLPLLLVAGPIFALIGYLAHDEPSFLTYVWRVYLGENRIEMAHMWFAAHLLVYSAAYALWRRGRGSSSNVPGPVPGHRAIIGLVIILALVTSLTRTFWPQDTWIKALGILPVEPAHLPQYVTLFALGILAGRRRWLERMAPRVGIVWLRIGLLALALHYLFAYSVAFGWLPVPYWAIKARAALFGLWETVVCVGLCIGLPLWARAHWNGPSRWVERLAPAVFGVYVFHVFILVGLQNALLGVNFPSLAKFLLVTLLGVFLAFALALVLRKIPGLRRIF
ncbi:acyltransferase family protein [Magnetospira sp. QH-2]|uniref:acyltransferase family protein n=1 Tax=Magnetospira sp. (strain QH-2) TaxID=1288970 RepID=UPI0003E80F61|nr:acyltransferase family protein [Magnetospira sp. QH-2]CCQ73467.1 Conserved membrane protein of unknown function [Magnetospira sp. QH-2]